LSSGLWGVIPRKLGAFGICCHAMGSVKKWNKILPPTIALTNKGKP